MDEDEIMMAALEAGADDVARDGEFWAVTCEATLTSILRTALEKEGVTVDSSDLTMIPTSMVELDDIAAVKSVLKLIDALEENDDVQDVYANFDIPDALLEQLAE
jgi:transcriptional/translational regulatory protein YebC/TACO1